MGPNCVHMSLTELYEFYLQHSRISTDSRTVQPGDLFFALHGERFDGNRFATAALERGAALAIVDDPGVVRDERYLLVSDTLTSLQALARHHRQQLAIPLLAVTGSNGKTTTKELLAAVLGRHYRLHYTRGNLNNHIGVPLTLLSMPADTEIAIIEMGANHQGEIDALCRIAEPTHGLVTNVGQAHLEGFGGFEGVIRGKGELYRYLAANDGVAFVNHDEPHLADMAAAVRRQVQYAQSNRPDSNHPPMEVQVLQLHPNIRYAFLDEKRELVSGDSHLSGQHNFQNILTAVAVAKYFKVPGHHILTAIADYVPSNNRSQQAEKNGIRFYLDAYNANPSSMEATLRNFSAVATTPRAVILGDMLELGPTTRAEHQRIGELARQQGYDRTILVGPLFAPIAAQLQVPHFADVAALRDWFWQQDWAGYTVLLKASRGIALDKLLH